MRTVLLASLRTHTRRYVAALVAVTIAVGFVVVTNALTSATKDGLSSGVAAAYRGADLVVGDDYGLGDADDAQRVLDVAEERGDVAEVLASGWLRVATADRKLGDDVPVGAVATTPDLLTQQIVAGRAPRAPDEAIVDSGVARSEGIAVGDTLTLGDGDETADVRVVGVAASRSFLSADVYVPWATLSTLPTHFADAVVYDVTDPSAVDARVTELERASESQVRTQAVYVDARVKALNQGVDVIGYLLLLFAAIAGFVSVLVIANTFTILFAQRTRDLALLRCVGATRRQVLRSVRVESFALAVLASVIGVVLGAVGGYAIAAIVRSFAGAERIGAVSLSPVWVVAAFVGGVVTTLAAAWWPTRAVTRVSPLAALRPQEDPTLGRRAGRIRVAFGALVGGAGVALLALAVASSSMPVMLLGGMAAFVGVLLLGPVIVPALLGLAGRLLGRTGPSVRLAAANAVRNPRRSAATTASLLVGVTLATAVLTGMASARSAVDTELDAQYPIDVALVGTTAVSSATVEDVASTPGVTQTVAVKGVLATIEGRESAVPLLGPSTADTAIAHDPDAVTPREGEVLLPMDVAMGYTDGVPERIDVTVDGRVVTLATRVVGAEWGEALVVAPRTFAGLGGDAADLAVWTRTSGDSDELDRALAATAKADGLEVTSTRESRDWVILQLDVLVWAVLGLLGVGVLIALVGIANTIGLSVLERRREHALLRALGLTRSQLRRMLAAEGVLLALVAAVIGTAVGTSFGWVGVQTVVRDAVPEAPLVMPWIELLAVVAVATLAGLAACVLPARRAARIAPATGLTLD